MNTLVAKNTDGPRPSSTSRRWICSKGLYPSNAGVEVISKLMDLQDRWQASHARRSFDEAMGRREGRDSCDHEESGG